MAMLLKLTLELLKDTLYIVSTARVLDSITLLLKQGFIQTTTPLTNAIDLT